MSLSVYTYLTVNSLMMDWKMNGKMHYMVDLLADRIIGKLFNRLCDESFNCGKGLRFDSDFT